MNCKIWFIAEIKRFCCIFLSKLSHLILICMLSIVMHGAKEVNADGDPGLLVEPEILNGEHNGEIDTISIFNKIKKYMSLQFLWSMKTI